MANWKRSFLLYADVVHTVDKLSNEKAGELFKHILSYVNDQDPTTNDPLIEIAFEPIKQSLKRDLQKYKETCKKNRDNARKRWDKKNATASDRMPSDANDADSDSDSDSDSDKENNNKERINYRGDYEVIKKRWNNVNKYITDKNNQVAKCTKDTKHLLEAFKKHRKEYDMDSFEQSLKWLVRVLAKKDKDSSWYWKKRDLHNFLTNKYGFITYVHKW